MRRGSRKRVPTRQAALCVRGISQVRAASSLIPDWDYVYIAKAIAGSYPLFVNLFLRRTP